MALAKLLVYHLQTTLAAPAPAPPERPPGHRLDSFVALAEFTDGSVRLGERTWPPGDASVTPQRLARRFKLLGRVGLGQLLKFGPAVAAPIKTCLDPTLARPL